VGTGGCRGGGYRALRDELSRHLAEVRRGRIVTVTDHGRVIVRIVPADGPTALERLIDEGRVQPAKRRKQPDESEPGALAKAQVAAVLERIDTRWMRQLDLELMAG
jgi:antitoxin (DNA-binding transcriptional repressor) of toxin-antitoxin stability system